MLHLIPYFNILRLREDTYVLPGLTQEQYGRLNAAENDLWLPHGDSEA